MKAAQIINYGDAQAIKLQENVQEPLMKPGQLLIEVHAASLNRIDTAIRNGYLKEILPLSFPITVGGDFAGIVSKVGEGVNGFTVGDEVYGNAGHFKGGTGAIAEFTVADANNTALKPKTLDFLQSAALSLVGTSALQGIEEEINIQAGQKILIQGGAGGIGAFAIQIAKLRGAYVATTVSGDDEAFVKSLGADEVIDYKSQDVTTILKDYDAILDTAGGDMINKLFSILKKGGILVTMAGQPNQDLAKQYGVKAVNQMTTVSTSQLTRLAALADSGKLKVHVEKIFPFDQVPEAFTYFETQHPKGKIVLSIK